MSRKKPRIGVGRPKLDVRKAEVDNPYFQRDHAESSTNPKTITAFINARESAVEMLYARGALDRPQKLSADRFRSLWEIMGAAGAGAIDYTREPVDGGRSADPISIRQLAAGRELKRCRELLGVRGFSLVSRVAGEGFSLAEVAGSGKRAKLSTADALRGFLDDLAEMWGYRSGAQQRSIVVQK